MLFHGTFRKTHFDGDFPLGKTVNPPQSEDLPYLWGKASDGLSQAMEFVAIDCLALGRRVVRHNLQIVEIRYGGDRNHLYPAKMVDDHRTRGLKGITPSVQHMRHALRRDQAGISFLNDVVDFQAIVA